MMKKAFTAAMLLLGMTGAFAQSDSTAPEAAAFKLSGSADVYYRYNFARTTMAVVDILKNEKLSI